MGKILRNNKKLGNVIKVYVMPRWDKWLNSLTNCQTAIWDMAWHYYQLSDCDTGHGLALLPTVRLRYGIWLGTTTNRQAAVKHMA